MAVPPRGQGTPTRPRHSLNKEHERIIVTVRGQPSAVLMAYGDLDALEETIAILSEHEASRRLIASDRELNSGDGESESDLAAAMRHRRQT